MSTERAPRGTLTRDRVVDAALSLADEQGLDALTMRALARRLDVKPMAIYHHVAGKDAILDLVVDRVFAEIDLPVPGRPWQPEIRRRALSARSVLLAHPWSISLLETRSVAQNPATLRHHDAVIGTLRRGGFGLALTARAFAMVDSYVYGFVLQEVTLPATSPQHLPAEVAALVDTLDAGAHPHLAELTLEYFLTPDYDFSDEFERGLDLLLGALERELAQQRADSP